MSVPRPNHRWEYHRQAVERTLNWAEQCKEAHGRPSEQGLFGIVQGGTDGALRQMCARRLIELDLPGYAIGGLAVGEGFAAMVDVLNQTAPLLPEGKPRYLMGVGYPRDIAAAVAAGRGHVRLRTADAQRAQRLCLHGRWPASAEEQPVCAGWAAD